MPAEVPNIPQNLKTALLEAVHALDTLRLRYALIGGIATGYRGRPRFTQDVDLLLEVPQIQLPGLLEDLQARGFTFDTQKVIREWNQEHLTVLSFRGVRVDWLKPTLPLYKRVLEQARQELWFGENIRIASPEGLILTKLAAFRTQDQADIENLLAANRGQLDLDLVRREWAMVADTDDSRSQRLNEMIDQFYLPKTPDEAS
jgi:hypothetical protein